MATRIGSRIPGSVMRSVSLVLLVSAAALGGEPLSLPQAIAMALKSNPLVAASEAGEKEAEARIRQARSGYMPRVNFSESVQRSNNPVFVFGSLLTQHQFTTDNFALGPLNRPDALNNYQSRLAIEQVLYDFRQTSRGVEVSRLGRQIAREGTRRSHADVILAVLRTYFGVGLAQLNLEVAEMSLKSAQADLDRATAIYQVGRSTEAEVLALRVHWAGVEEQRIRAANDLAVAQAALNDALGVELDRVYELTTPLEPGTRGTSNTLEGYRKMATEHRPELLQADLAQRLAGTQEQQARSTYWPQAAFQGIVEADRQRFYNRGGSNWLAAVTLRWSVWNGGETKARVEQARFARERAEALRKRADSAVELEVRKAYLDLAASAQRLEVTTAAVIEAEEAHRIIQNRHAAGLTTVTELLRSDTALSTARTRKLAAVYDLRVAAATVEHAAGNLTADSAVVN